MAENSDPRDALTSIVGGLQSSFKRFTRAARQKAWRSLHTGPGKEKISALLNNPSQQVRGLPKLLSFKEWLGQNP